jgi:hypothetical protein
MVTEIEMRDEVLLHWIPRVTTSAEHNATVRVPGCQDEIIVMYSLTSL